MNELYLFTGLLLFFSVSLLLVVLLFHGKSRMTNLGEATVARELKHLNQRRYRVLHNILLKNGGESVQIDHIVIGRSGIYVIETKHYHGLVSGGENTYHWHHYIGGKDYEFYNPCRQNRGHIRVLKRLLRDYSDLPVYSIVAFPTECGVEVDTDETEVVHYDELVPTIRAHFMERYITYDEVRLIAGTVLTANSDTRRDQRDHVSSVQSKSELAQKRIEKNRCPRCGGRLKYRFSLRGSYYTCRNATCRYSIKNKR